MLIYEQGTGFSQRIKRSTAVELHDTAMYYMHRLVPRWSSDSSMQHYLSS